MACLAKGNRPRSVPIVGLLLLCVSSFVCTATAAAFEVGPIREFLGQSINLGVANMWAFRNLFQIEILHNAPDWCFVDSECRHIASSASYDYASTKEWTQKMQTDIGLTGGMEDVESVSSSLGASFGTSSSNIDDRSVFYTEVYNRQRCFEVEMECVSNKNYLDPNLYEVVATLPKAGTHPDIMKQWVDMFIQRFGSHVRMRTLHGAMAKTLTTVAKQAAISAECLQLEASADYQYVGSKINATSHSDLCKAQLWTSDLATSVCLLIGGNVDAIADASSICSASPASSALLSDFLQSGDLTSGSSIIRSTFMPISTTLRFTGFPKEAAMLDAAVSFQSCTEPRFQWHEGLDGNFRCKCQLKCQNGGDLDEDACVCTCRGNHRHGFNGVMCETEYGHCQHGKASGNPHGHFCGRDNVCSSSVSKHFCTPSEVCCLTDIHGKCCPYESTCNCGAFSCSCKLPTTQLEGGFQNKGWNYVYYLPWLMFFVFAAVVQRYRRQQNRCWRDEISTSAEYVLLVS